MREIIAIFYRITDGQVVGWSDHADLVIKQLGDRFDVTSPDLVMRGVDGSVVTYGLYKYKEIARRYQEAGGEGVEIPWTLSELNLEPITADKLPHSIHIAVLTSVNIGNKTATVTRKFRGENYDIPDCEPTDYMIEEYKAGRLDIGDKVMVEFMEEYPQDELVVIPVIFAKRSA